MQSLTATLLQTDLARARKPLRDRVITFRLLILLATQLRALMDRRLASSDITTQQAALLSVASAAPAPPTQGEMAGYLGVSQQNVRQLVEALSRKGLLEIRSDPHDRRSKLLSPTKAVKAMFARRNAKDFAAIASWFSALTDDEIRLLVSLLSRLAEAVAAERARGAS